MDPTPIVYDKQILLHTTTIFDISVWLDEVLCINETLFQYYNDDVQRILKSSKCKKNFDIGQITNSGSCFGSFSNSNDSIADLAGTTLNSSSKRNTPNSSDKGLESGSSSEIKNQTWNQSKSSSPNPKQAVESLSIPVSESSSRSENGSPIPSKSGEYFVSNRFSCRRCGNIVFASRAEMMLHYKSQLHTANQKRSLAGLPPLMEGIASADACSDHGGISASISPANAASVESDSEEECPNSMMYSDESDGEEGYYDEETGLEAEDSYTDIDKRVQYLGTVTKHLDNVNGTQYVFSPNSFPGTSITVHASLMTLVQRHRDVGVYNDFYTNPWTQLSQLLHIIRSCSTSLNTTLLSDKSQLQQHAINAVYNNPYRSSVEAQPYWAIFLLQSGKFAGAIFDTRSRFGDSNPNSFSAIKGNIDNNNNNRASPCVPKKLRHFFDPNQGSDKNLLNTISSSSSYTSTGDDIVHSYGRHVQLEHVKAIKHKVLHRYTVRAKAGGAQSTHDGRYRSKKSMGAQLRRHGEEALKADIYAILKEWSTTKLDIVDGEEKEVFCTDIASSYLGRCGHIFISSSKSMYNILVKDSNSESVYSNTHTQSNKVNPNSNDYYKLDKNDYRITNRVGFMVKKPTYEECIRVYHLCTTVTLAHQDVSNCVSSTVVECATTATTTATAMGSHNNSIPIAIAIEFEDENHEEHSSNVAVVEAEHVEDSPLLSKLLISACYNNDLETIQMIVDGYRHCTSTTSQNADHSPSGAALDTAVNLSNDVIHLVEDSADINTDADPAIEDERNANDSNREAEMIFHSFVNSYEQELEGAHSDEREDSGDAVVTLGTDGHGSVATLDTNSQQEYRNLQRQYHEELNVNDVFVSHLAMGYDLHSILNAPENLITFKTPLHIVTELGYTKLIQKLLLTGLVDPSKEDINGKFPFHYCNNKACRDIYRKIRGICENVSHSQTIGMDPNSSFSHLLSLDWDKCGIPSGLTVEMEQQHKDKDREKKKRNRLRKKEREKEEKLVKKQEKNKMELANAQKAAQKELEIQNAGVCFICSKSLFQHKQVIDIYDKKCCSAACVMGMRRKLSAEAAERRMNPTKE